MNFDKEIVEKALFLCQEFLCGECPYDKYQSHDHPIKCMNMLIRDLCELEKEKIQGRAKDACK